MNGNAAIMAARALREKLIAAVAHKLDVPEQRVFVSRGALCVVGDESRAVPISDAIQMAEAEFGTLGTTGWYKSPPNLGWSYRGGNDRGVTRVFVHRPCCRSDGQSRDRRRDRSKGLLRARLRPRALSGRWSKGRSKGSVYMGVARRRCFEEHSCRERRAPSRDPTFWIIAFPPVSTFPRSCPS